jgi:hypothetical protein
MRPTSKTMAPVARETKITHKTYSKVYMCFTIQTTKGI